MCDECSKCYRPAWETGELRLSAVNELICSDCHADHFTSEDDSWDGLLTAEDLAAMNEAAQDDKAHAARERDDERRMAA